MAIRPAHQMLGYSHANLLLVKAGLQLQNNPIFRKPTPNYLGIKYHFCNLLSGRKARTFTRRLGERGWSDRRKSGMWRAGFCNFPISPPYVKIKTSQIHSTASAAQRAPPPRSPWAPKCTDKWPTLKETPPRSLLVVCCPNRNGALTTDFLTKNTGSPNGEKSMTFTSTGLVPCCWGLYNLGDTLKSCLMPWLIRPWW